MNVNDYRDRAKFSSKKLNQIEFNAKRNKVRRKMVELIGYSITRVERHKKANA